MLREKKLSELAARRDKVLNAGGAGKIEKQHAEGKFTARERIYKLLDEGSFVELDQFVTHRCVEFDMAGEEVPGEGVVTGFGTIDGRLVYVFSQDFTVLGGSLGEMHAAKIAKVMDLAVKTGAPFIGLNDSGGARIQEGIDALNGYGEIFKRNIAASGLIPQISVILGPCAGGAAYSPALTDFVFMVNKISQMFIAGPQVIKAVTGEDVTNESLGGAMVHNKISGNAHFYTENEEECFAQIRKLLSYLPSNNLEAAPVLNNRDCIERIDETIESRDDILETVIPEDPSKPYDMKKVILAIADHKDFFEIQPHYAKNIIIGFMRLNGRPVGVIANQPLIMAGCLDINSSDKASRFIRFCDAFNIPLLTIADTPGYLPGVDQEHGGILRHGAKLLYAYHEATVPKIQLITRKAYGGAYLAMCGKAMGADLAIAWPSAEIAVMGAQAAANVVFRKEIQNAENPQEKRQEKISEYEERFSNPYCAAARGFTDLVIEPERTRYYLIRSFESLQAKRESRPEKKHGNIPL